MKCPFCGAEMDDGFVVGYEPHSVLLPNALHWQKTAERTKLFAPKQEIPAAQGWRRPMYPSHKCPRCRKIIMDAYPTEQ